MSRVLGCGMDQAPNSSNVATILAKFDSPDVFQQPNVPHQGIQIIYIYKPKIMGNSHKTYGFHMIHPRIIYI